MQLEQEYTWASPLEVDGDWVEVESEVPLVWGGLDFCDSCCIHKGKPRDTVPGFTGEWELPRFSK